MGKNLDCYDNCIVNHHNCCWVLEFNLKYSFEVWVFHMFCLCIIVYEIKGLMIWWWESYDVNRSGVWFSAGWGTKEAENVFLTCGWEYGLECVGGLRSWEVCVFGLAWLPAVCENLYFAIYRSANSWCSYIVRLGLQGKFWVCFTWASKLWMSNLIVLFCSRSCVQCFQPFPDGLFYEASLFSFVFFFMLDSPKKKLK